MSLIMNKTLWFAKGAQTDDDIETGWYNVEVLNGCQFFIRYENGAVDCEAIIFLSPADAHGRDGITDDDRYDYASKEYELLASGDHSELGFFDPPAVMDRPFKSFKIEFAPDDDLGRLWFCLCPNGARE